MSTTAYHMSLCWASLIQYTTLRSVLASYLSLALSSRLRLSGFPPQNPVRISSTPIRTLMSHQSHPPHLNNFIQINSSTGCVNESSIVSPFKRVTTSEAINKMAERRKYCPFTALEQCSPESWSGGQVVRKCMECLPFIPPSLLHLSKELKVNHPAMS